MGPTRASGGGGGRAGAGRGRRVRRALLAALATGAIAAPAISSGCVAGFDPPSVVRGLRVFAVVADKPYALPGDTVSFTIHYQDAATSPDEGARPISIFWIGGCENPIGDDYYGCYPQFAELAGQLEGWTPGDPLPSLDGVSPGFGETYSVKLGEDIVSSRERPASGPHYGTAYVFFVACAGTPGPVDDEGTGKAGSFPVGCFDAEGRRLGAEGFVAGYTQVYVFDDGRMNANPELQGLALDGAPLPEDFGDIPTVPRCPIGAEERREAGCSAEDPFTACTAYDLDALVSPDAAEPDPDAKLEPLKEILWVDYFADQGDLDGSIKLVSDAATGYIEDHAVKWIPPAEPGIATLTAVLRDARGGASVVRRLVRVE
ncbi:hypothetical protein WMF31_25570 [Sorangium sp. So ce1036]|uniref:hypothetical protein n=1 Tax=Sorangium sp. So ce1036 TaxID=3133328 RepID=UPI003F0004C4